MTPALMSPLLNLRSGSWWLPPQAVQKLQLKFLTAESKSSIYLQLKLRGQSSEGKTTGKPLQTGPGGAHRSPTAVHRTFEKEKCTACICHGMCHSLPCPTVTPIQRCGNGMDSETLLLYAGPQDRAQHNWFPSPPMKCCHLQTAISQPRAKGWPGQIHRAQRYFRPIFQDRWNASRQPIDFIATVWNPSLCECSPWELFKYFKTV